MNTNAFRLLLLTIGLYIAALTVDLKLLYYLSYVLIGVLIVSWVWARFNLSGLEIHREAPRQQAQVGYVFEESCSVRNASSLPKLWVGVRDYSTLPGHQAAAVIALNGLQSKRWRVRTRTRRRGLYQLGPLTAVSGDPFGLFRSWRTVPEMGELLVYPATVDLAAFGLPENELPGGTHVRGRAHSITPNASGLREYVSDDPTNRIHWPATARQRRLMVKEFELDPTSNIWIVLDLDRTVHLSAPRAPGQSAQPAGNTRMFHLRELQTTAHDPAEGEPLYIEPDTEEYGVTIAASLAANMLAQDREIGLLATAGRPILIPPDRGARQLSKILRALAVARAEDSLNLGQLMLGQHTQFSRNDTLIIVTPSTSEGWVAALHDVQLRGCRAVAVLIEPSTFGSGYNALLSVGALAAIDVPSYLVKRDDRLELALSKEMIHGRLR